ncbi:hypothetical protein I4U23_021731 [Adineta vaga]|nr:hypothetical protein I4U23_021731 [Adineta vaga]
MLLTVFNKLNVVDVLYSLVDVNGRFNRLVFNACDLHNLNLVNVKTKSCLPRFSALKKHVLNRICDTIVPRIHEQVNKLTVEQNFQAETLLKYLKVSITVCNVNVNISLSSNADIQNSFIGKIYGQVGSYVDTFSMGPEGRSHVYSLPYKFHYFLYLDNSFQRGTFDKVIYLNMTDIDPFEYEFFKVISEDFPFLKYLSIENDESQTTEQYSSTLIVFPHLICLNLLKAHVNYAEQFLYDKNTSMPCLLILEITYESLILTTNNFNNDKSRLNCSNLRQLKLDVSFVRPQNFHQYFPLL